MEDLENLKLDAIVIGGYVMNILMVVLVSHEIRLTHVEYCFSTVLWLEWRERTKLWMSRYLFIAATDAASYCLFANLFNYSVQLLVVQLPEVQPQPAQVLK